MATSTSTCSRYRRATRGLSAQATTFGTVAKEHGALSYREFRGDDVDDNFEVRDGELLTAAVAEFESRAHRDAVMNKVMKDPRVTERSRASRSPT